MSAAIEQMAAAKLRGLATDLRESTDSKIIDMGDRLAALADEMDPLRRIQNPLQLRDFMEDNGMRPDWHEPDEQGVNAEVIGNHLDNAMGSQMPPDNVQEFNVILTKDGRPAAVVNLATLLSWACKL